MSSPREFKMEELIMLLGKEERDYNVCLHKPEKWIEWEDALALMGKDVYITKVEPSAREQLWVAYVPTGEDALSLRYDKRMQFVLKR